MIKVQTNSQISLKAPAKWKQGLGWGLYDVGTSAYFLVFALYLFPVFLSTRVFTGNQHFALYWGISQGLAVFLAVIAGLTCAKALDARGLRQVAPLVVALAPIVTFLLPLLIALDAAPFTLLGGYVIVHAFYLFSLTVYDASLVRIAEPGQDRAIVSGWAWGWGYIGGLTCMGVMEVGLLVYQRYSAWDFCVGALFFLTVSLMAARWLRRTLNQKSTTAVTLTRDVGQVAAHMRTPWGLLLSMMLVVDGIAVFMSYTGLYGTHILRLEERQITLMLALLQLLAFPLTGIVATLGRRNVPRTLVWCGFGWLATVFFLVSASGVVGLFLTIVVVSGVVGSTQALLRALYADRVLLQQGIEGFSRYAVVEKGAAFLGPVVAGSLIPFMGYKVVMVASGIIIFIGLACTWKIARIRPASRQ